MLVAFDDTDSPRGMCTTYLVPRIYGRLSRYCLLGLPRLVRLNPNVPWKTRGNGAVCMDIGIPSGNGVKFGTWKGETMEYYPKGTEPDDPTPVFEAVAETVMSLAHIDAEGTNPAVALFSEKPDPRWYERAVTDVVPIKDVKEHARNNGVMFRVSGNGRGLVGATGAAAWPAERSTYEVIAYRYRDRWGTGRAVDLDRIRELDRSFPSTFNNYDPHTGHAAVLPNTPCPVLYGVRGFDEDELLGVPAFMKGEAPEGWVLFKSNQGSGDHIVPGNVGGLRAYGTYSLDGRVSGMPGEHPGGLVTVPFEDATGSIDLLFYEPTKEFRKYARLLRPGDTVTVEGAFRREPRGINVESFTVRGLVRHVSSVKNPACPSCGGSTESMGRGQGFRCRSCGTRTDAQKIVVYEERDIGIGRYQVPVGARRHLHAPDPGKWLNP